MNKNETKIYVPYKIDNLGKKYLLYKVKIDKYPRKIAFDIPRIKNPPQVIIDKLMDLWKYFKNRQFDKECKLQFQLESVSLENQYICELDNNSTSIFLGLFLTAAVIKQGKKFKENWKMVCATGNLDYDINDEALNFISIKDESIISKYKDEFENEARKLNEKCLFLYINDEDIINKGDGDKQGVTLSNITVKRFSSGNIIEELFDYLFINFPSDYNFDDLESEQREFIDKINKNIENNDYIQGYGFKEIESAMLNNKWKGFFIEGVGGSGKSALAKELAHELIWVRKIYAYIWIEIDNDNIRKKINEITSDKKEKNPIEKLGNYIISIIKEQTHYDINSLNKILSKKNYLIIFDNLEMKDYEFKLTIQALKNVFFNLTGNPYIIITSRFYYNTPELDWFCLKKVTPPKLLENHIIDFIKKIIEREGIIFKNNKTINDNKLLELAQILFKNFGDIPELIITAVKLLRYVIIEDLIKEINIRLGKGEQTIREKMISIYYMAFLSLNLIQKKLLFFILSYNTNNTKDNLLFYDEENISNEENIFNEDDILKKGWNYSEILINSLRILKDHNLLYSIEKDNKIYYGIKTVPYHTILFENEFLHSLPDYNDYFRDTIIPISLQLEIALINDMPEDIIINLLERLKKNDNHIFKSDIDILLEETQFIKLAARYISNPNILSHIHKARHNNLSIQKDLYLHNIDDFSVLEEAIKNPEIKIFEWLVHNNYPLKYDFNNICHLAAKIGNINVLDWTKIHKPDFLNEKTGSSQGDTIFHIAVKYGNIPVLKWLFKNKLDLINLGNGDGATPFYLAIAYSNINVIEEFFNYIYSTEFKLDIVNSKGYKGATVFHAAATNLEDKTYIINKLFLLNHVLINDSDIDGNTVFHYAVHWYEISIPRLNILNWLYTHAKKLLKKSNHKDETVFHTIFYSEEYCLRMEKNARIKLLNWLYKYTRELLYKSNNKGETVFHYAILYGSLKWRSVVFDIDKLDWLYKHAKKILFKTNNKGETVFHYAIFLYKERETEDTMILDWLFKHAKRILNKPDKNGHTILHYAIRLGTINALNWLKNYIPIISENNTSIINYALEYGTLDVLDWLYNNFPYLHKYLTENTEKILKYTKSRNSLNILKWLYKCNPTLLSIINKSNIIQYLSGRHLYEDINWIKKYLPELFDIKNTDNNIYINILDYIDENKTEVFFETNDVYTEQIIDSAIKERNLVVLTWFSSKKPQIIKYLENDHIKFDPNRKDIFKNIEKNCDSHILDWLLNNLPSFFRWICLDSKKDITIYEILPFTDNTFLLDWLNNHSLKNTNESDEIWAGILYRAASEEYINILDWFLKYKRELFEWKVNIHNTIMTFFDFAINYKKLKILNWLIINEPDLLKCTENDWSTIFHSFLLNGNTEILKWISINKPELLKFIDNNDIMVVYNAVNNNNIELLEWILKYSKKLIYCKDTSGKTIYNYAAENNNKLIVNWLKKHVPALCKLIKN